MISSKGGRWSVLGLSLLWTIIIFVGCSLPGKDIPAVHLFDHFDKIVHFIFFFIFAFLWLNTVFLFFPGERKNIWVYIILIILSSFLYGFALEFYQFYFVQGRSWDIWDGIADGIGGSAGSAAFYIRKKQ